MTSTNTGLRRAALVALAVGTAIGATACSAGQHSQTAYQVAAVDGGQGHAGELHVNDLVVVIPESDSSEARVGFVVSHTGSDFGTPVSLSSLTINGTPVQVSSAQPLARGCALIADVAVDATPAPAAENTCTETVTATLPVTGGLEYGHSVPATLTFSNGDRIETQAGVIAEILPAGEYTRPAETLAPAEGH